MPTPHHHSHWSAAGPAVETTAPAHLRAHADWLARMACRAGLAADEALVAEMTVVERCPASLISRRINRRKVQVVAMQERALSLLSQLPDFWNAARRFERDLLPCAENRDDREHRPDELRGVTPDRASDRLHGSKIVSFGDLRLRQDVKSACRLAMYEAL